MHDRSDHSMDGVAQTHVPQEGYRAKETNTQLKKGQSSQNDRRTASSFSYTQQPHTSQKDLPASKMRRQRNYKPLVAVFTLFLIATGSYFFFTKEETTDLPDPVKITLSDNKEIEIDHNPTLHLPFIQNSGAKDDAVKYYAPIFAGTAFITDNNLTYSIIKKEQSQDEDFIDPYTPDNLNKAFNERFDFPEDVQTKTIAFSESFTNTKGE